MNKLNIKKSAPFFKLLLSGFTLCCLALLWAMALYENSDVQSRDLREAQARTSAQAQVLGAFTSSTIKRINEIILSLRPQWHGDWQAFAEQVKKHQESLVDISYQVSVIDRDGLLAFTNLAAPTTRSDLSQREHFFVHQNAQGKDQLFISKALLGKVSGKWTIQFTRPIYQDQKFVGVIVLSVSPELFAAFTDKIHNDHSQGFALMRQSGDILAIHPWKESALGQPAKDLGIQPPEEGSFGTMVGSAADGAEHIYGFNRLSEFGLIQTASIPKASVLATSDRHRNNVLLLASIVSVLLVGFALLLYRSILQMVMAQNELMAAKGAAEHANASKSRFLSNMSHEIRTPMNAVLGMLNLLKGTPLNAQQRDYAEKSESATKSLLRLLNDILDFSKMDAGMMTMELHPFRLDKLMRDLAIVLSANVLRKPVEVLFDVDAALPPVVAGDALRLSQVLINLSNNALKFTSTGEVILSVRLASPPNDSALIEFAVSDTGVGIAPEQQERIFSEFTQAEASTTRRFGGTGLGLAISKGLVEVMGGVLKIDSTVGQGSRFYFSLPLPVVRDAPADLTQAAPPLPRPLEALVVDDNPVALGLMVKTLQTHGVNTTGVGSGAAAVQRLLQRCQAHQKPFDVVLLDWQMPDLDGWETAQQIKAMNFGLHSPPRLLMVSANGPVMLADRTEQEQAMLSGFLAKPLSPDMLFEAIAQAYDEQHTKSRVGHTGRVKRGLERMRILVVEDNLLNQQVAEELLTREGALVSLTANGQLGVEAVAAADPPFDVVLMDLQMPVLDGWSATRKIREDLGLKTLPIIAMSANAMEQDRVESLAAGMNDHVGKPFELTALVTLLRRHSGWTEIATEKTQPKPLTQKPHCETKSAPDDIGRIDFEQALEWVGGDAVLYLSFAQSYVQDVANYADRLAQHLAQGEQKDAARLMHTLKGLSATVGAVQLADFAAKKEIEFKASMPEPQSFDALVQQTRSGIEAVTAELAELSDKIRAKQG